MPGDNGEESVKRHKGLVRGCFGSRSPYCNRGSGALSFAEGASAATATVTVTPSTGLQAQGNTTVTVSGSGPAGSSAGAILECNDYGVTVATSTPQPTVALEGHPAPVSCGPNPSLEALPVRPSSEQRAVTSRPPRSR